MKCVCGLTKAESRGEKTVRIIDGVKITWQKLKCSCGQVRTKRTVQEKK